MPAGAPCQISCGVAAACGTDVQRRRPHWRQLWHRQAAATCSVGRRAVPRRCALQVHAALFDPPPFDPSKLSVCYLSGVLPARLATPRRYTLTHNDLTGALTLTIGASGGTNRAGLLDLWCLQASDAIECCTFKRLQALLTTSSSWRGGTHASCGMRFWRSGSPAAAAAPPAAAATAAAPT